MIKRLDDFGSLHGKLLCDGVYVFLDDTDTLFGSCHFMNITSIIPNVSGYVTQKVVDGVFITLGTVSSPIEAMNLIARNRK